MARRNPTRPLPAGSFEERFNTGVLDPTKWVASSYSGAVGTNATNTGVWNPNRIDLSSGMLRLKLTQTGTAGVAVTSTGAEISTLNSFGYGTYDFVARMSSTSDTPNGAGTNVSGTISALFNYGTDSVTEIDFELEGIESRKNDLTMTSYRYAGITYLGTVSGETTATLPTHKKHDLILAFAFRDGSTTAPTVPAGWTTWATPAGANGCSMVLAYRVATAPGTAAGTWTNATGVTFHLYQGCDITAPLGGVATGAGTASSVTYPAITITDTPAITWQLPWVARFAGHVNTDTSLGTAPTGMTNRSNFVGATAELAGHDTNGEYSGTSYASNAVAVGGTASSWFAVTVELRRQLNDSIPTKIEGLYTGFNAYRWIWAPGSLQYFVNGQLKATHTDVVPETAVPIFINHWGTDNVNFGGTASPGSGNDRYMYVSYVRFIPA